MHAITNARFEGPKVYFEVDPPFSLLQQSSNRLTKAAMSHWKQQMPSCSLNNLLAIGNMCAMLQYLQEGKADHAGNAGFSIEPSPFQPIDALHCTSSHTTPSNPVGQNRPEIGSALELSCQTTATQLAAKSA